MKAKKSFNPSFSLLLRPPLPCSSSDGLLPESVASQLGPQLSRFGRNLWDTLKKEKNKYNAVASIPAAEEEKETGKLQESSPSQAGSTDGPPELPQTWPARWLPSSSGSEPKIHLPASRRAESKEGGENLNDRGTTQVTHENILNGELLNNGLERCTLECCSRLSVTKLLSSLWFS